MQLSEGRKILTAVIPAFALFLSTLGIGFIMGMTVPPFIRGLQGGGYTNLASKNLTWNEFDSLRWAKSKEGRFARNLMDWNRGYLETGQCVNDVARLGVVLSVEGRRTKFGSCLIWAVPPSKRKFVR